MPQKYMRGTVESVIRDPQSGKPIELHVEAKDGCKKCHGRGFTGWYREGSAVKPWLCKCFVEAVVSLAEDKHIPVQDVKIDIIDNTDKENESKISLLEG